MGDDEATTSSICAYRLELKFEILADRRTGNNASRTDLGTDGRGSDIRDQPRLVAVDDGLVQAKSVRGQGERYAAQFPNIHAAGSTRRTHPEENRALHRHRVGLEVT